MSETLKERLSGVQAVTEALPDHPAVKVLLGWNPRAIVDALLDRGELSLTVPSTSILEAAQALQAAGYNFFEDMTAVDWFPSAPRFQLSYHLLSHAYKERIRLRAFVEEANPELPSITPAWPAANYYEREVFDLFGIRFTGHPNLRRIMMPDEWEGYPLRKDYPVEGYR
ncbi:NADH-quinone oxidoreductase subunit C [Telmatobacter bradus]|uniref:NADH-quinone oxidoreductase subunit C n=1 Tax=Telmatobacter bradus TaxID=474953 RepID=UPI003B4351BF